MAIVYGASRSMEKIMAFSRGWYAVPHEVQVVDFQFIDAPSGVSEQPVNEEIEQGARNRIAAVKAQLGEWAGKGYNPAQVYYIALESGIFVDPENQMGEEATICVIENNGKTVVKRSKGRVYPYYIVREAVARGVVTLKEHNKLVQDWYDACDQNQAPLGKTEKIASRVMVMTDVVRDALAATAVIPSL